MKPYYRRSGYTGQPTWTGITLRTSDVQIDWDEYRAERKARMEQMLATSLRESEYRRNSAKRRAAK